ncbi:MAG: 4-hydroxythreonine-4-phosphate dehydrogenase PdxA [Candidatus Melainabacteria bacterium GWA2_34_9]|nr:MAG: 4-hydroxythreonine-4-phosphate dehydrogenase PdxA [Candidatus Melainabacteria bacterium GWA2_34_9]
MENNKRIAITIGDVGGIGPEIIIKALNSPEISVKPDDILLIGNKDLFYNTAADLGLDLPEDIEVFDIPLEVSKIVVGKPTIESGKHSFLALEKACELAEKGKIRAIATAPTSKEAMNDAGYHYTGQTEILEKFLGSEESESEQRMEGRLRRPETPFKASFQDIPLKPEMLFVAGNLKVMLLTRHKKLASVASALTIDGIIKSIIALNNSLIKDFKLNNPRIAVCGLNPHAGENGLLGNEEADLIKPALNKLRTEYNILAEGPFPADTLWAKAANAYIKCEILPYDAYVACYHDQGLIPVKMLAMDKAVNTTINLPVIRTSPSHGTAYDIAGQNRANCQSMIEAINLADILS